LARIHAARHNWQSETGFGIEAVKEWISEDLGTVALMVAAGVMTGIVKDALQARRDDRRWFGLDLRRLWRVSPEDRRRSS